MLGTVLQLPSEGPGAQTCATAPHYPSSAVTYYRDLMGDIPYIRDMAPGGDKRSLRKPFLIIGEMAATMVHSQSLFSSRQVGERMDILRAPRRFSPALGCSVWIEPRVIPQIDPPIKKKTPYALNVSEPPQIQRWISPTMSQSLGLDALQFPVSQLRGCNFKCKTHLSGRTFNKSTPPAVLSSAIHRYVFKNISLK